MKGAGDSKWEREGGGESVESRFSSGERDKRRRASRSMRRERGGIVSIIFSSCLLFVVGKARKGFDRSPV